MHYKLFSYGTLQLEHIQQQLFGRILKGHPDILKGYKLNKIAIKDETVIATSGATHYPIAVYTGDQADIVNGVTFPITADELLQADIYEADDYKRVLVTAESGEMVWVYVQA